MARPTKKIIQPIKLSIEQMTKAMIQGNKQQKTSKKDEIKKQCSEKTLPKV